MDAEPTDDVPAPVPARRPHSSRVTSVSLLQKAQANDQDAWRRLVHLYRPLVIFWLGRGGVRDADADDVAQEVFQAAAAGLSGFRRDRPGDTFRGWLRGITRNLVLLHYRRAGRQPQATGGSDAFARMQEIPSPADDTDDPPEEVGNLYRRALEMVRVEFEERTWRAFWLTVVEGRSPLVVAPELGVTPAAVRQSKSRVLRRLKEEVGDLHLGPTAPPASA
jgi:RNA polymerase sigma-70 factor, ECF subfamily